MRYLGLRIKYKKALEKLYEPLLNYTIGGFIINGMQRQRPTRTFP